MQGVQFQSLARDLKSYLPRSATTTTKAIAIVFASFHSVNTPAVTNFKVSSELMTRSCEQGSETQSRAGARAEPSAAPAEGHLRGDRRGAASGPRGERRRTDHRSCQSEKALQWRKMGSCANTNVFPWSTQQLRTSSQSQCSISWGVPVTSPRPATCRCGSQDQARQRSNTQPKHSPKHLPTASGFQPLLDLISHLDPDFMSQCPRTHLNGIYSSCPQPPRCGTQNPVCFPTSCGIH